MSLHQTADRFNTILQIARTINNFYFSFFFFYINLFRSLLYSSSSNLIRTKNIFLFNIFNDTTHFLYNNTVNFSNKLKKKKKNFHGSFNTITNLLYNDSFLEIFLRFSMPRRIVINPEKNNIKLWTKSIFVSKKKVYVEKEEKNRER